MAGLKIRRFPDPILRKSAAKVSGVTSSLKKTLAEMAQTMYLTRGVGLAALQVGIDKQMAVIDIGDGLKKLINPVIVKSQGSSVEEEGCLSVPNQTVKVKRAKKVTVNFLNEDGETNQIRAEGLLARVIQHEIDHLTGTLIVDYLNPIKRLILRTKFSKGLDPSAKAQGQVLSLVVPRQKLGTTLSLSKGRRA